MSSPLVRAMWDNSPCNAIRGGHFPMGKLIELTGRYGNLTVIKRAAVRGGPAYWLCRCACGNEKEVRGVDLIHGRVVSCGCVLRSGKDETGKRYGLLVVINHVKTDYRGWHWLCQCDCGNQTIAVGSELRKGVKIGCGCRRTLPEGVAGRNVLLHYYKGNAARRGIRWELSKEEFNTITQQPCHYCGGEPENVMTREDQNGAYIYNGIDRKDNNRAYELNNVVPCCKRCNYAKNDATYDEFIKYLDRLVEHRLNQKQGENS